MPDKGQNKVSEIVHRAKDAHNDNFVLEKNIFSNIFEKDIRRVFIYKKAERLAKAIHLIAPAFLHSVSLKDRLEKIAIGLVDAAILPPSSARHGLSRELLALSSVLSIARTSGLLSPMNADLISKEAHALLQEVASYEEPQLVLEEVLTLSDISRKAGHQRPVLSVKRVAPVRAHAPRTEEVVSYNKSGAVQGERKERVLAVLQNKGQSSIKDISTVIRGVSEKTIQRELQVLVEQGLIKKSGERRWSTYALA